MEPRPAATVVMARPARRGVEVLTLRRSAGSRFAPGFTVFPGGTIDEDDAPLAERLFGDPGEAARACAVRELAEEAGILLTAGGPRGRPADAPVASLPFDPPPAEALVEISRWIAPKFLEVRFDARFFAVGAPDGLIPAPDGTEIEEARWTHPGAVLSRNARGEAPLMWPTLVMLEALAGCGSVEDVLALRVEQIAPPLRKGMGPGRRVGLPEGLRGTR